MPGTILSCLVSGASYGYALLWALFLSYIMLIFLQSQMTRLGVVTQKGYLRNYLLSRHSSKLRFLWPLVLYPALLLGAAAYEASNFSSFQAGMYCLFPKMRSRWILVLFFLVLAFLIVLQLYQKLEHILVFFLLMISGLFFLSAIQTNIEWMTVIRGLTVPVIQGSQDNWLCICSLVGTVIIPYALFMMARDSADRWEHDLHAARINTLATQLLSGVISAAVLITAADQLPREVVVNSSATVFSAVFQWFGGSISQRLLGFCLVLSAFASGLLVPVHSVSFLQRMLPERFKLQRWFPALVSLGILCGGLLISIRWFSNPVLTVLRMLTANVILFPLIPIGLLLVMNSRSLGEYRNSVFDNFITVIVFLMAVFLGLHAFVLLFIR